MSQFSFNASNVDPSDTFTPIPAGIYLAHIIESDVKATKQNNGQYIAATLEVLDGQFKGHKVFTNINIQNANADAERIGQKQLSQLCHAVGVLQLSDTAQLHNRPVRIKVTIKKDEQYGDKNEVRGYEAVNAATASAPAAPAQTTAAPAQAAAAPAARKAAPWETKKAAA